MIKSYHCVPEKQRSLAFGLKLRHGLRRHSLSTHYPGLCSSRVPLACPSSHFDGSSEGVLSASCESDFSSSAQRSIVFAMKHLWCSTTCSGLRQARSADQASTASSIRARAMSRVSSESACVPRNQRTSACLLPPIRSDKVVAQASVCDAWRCCVVFVASNMADPPVTLRRTTRQPPSRAKSGLPQFRDPGTHF